MGMVATGADMTLHSAAPATRLIARAFTGHLPIVSARPVTSPPTLSWRGRYHGRRPASGHEALKKRSGGTLNRSQSAPSASRPSGEWDDGDFDLLADRGAIQTWAGAGTWS